MEYSEVKNLFKSLNEITKNLKKVSKSPEDIIIKMVELKEITGYNTNFYFDKKLKKYFFQIHCNNTIPACANSKSFVEARLLAHKTLLYNINNTITNEYNKVIENDKRYSDEELKERINSELQNSKATEEEQEDEKLESCDSKKYETEWDYYPDKIKIRDLNDELNLYHSSRGKSYNLSNSDLTFDYEQNEKMIEQNEKMIEQPKYRVSFGRKHIFKQVKLCKDCGRSLHSSGICCVCALKSLHLQKSLLNDKKELNIA